MSDAETILTSNHDTNILIWTPQTGHDNKWAGDAVGFPTPLCPVVSLYPLFVYSHKGHSQGLMSNTFETNVAFP